MKKIIMIALTMFLINITSFSSAVIDKQISISVDKCHINEYVNTKTNFLKDYGVLFTVLTAIILFIGNRVYTNNEKKKIIKKIKSQLILIQTGILKEIQNTGDSIEEIKKNKDKKPLLLTTTPSKDSLKLDLMYTSYNEKLDKNNIEYLDNLYYINSKFKTAKEHLMKYLSNVKNEYDLLAADTIIKIVEEEIKNLKS